MRCARAYVSLALTMPLLLGVTSAARPAVASAGDAAAAELHPAARQPDPPHFPESYTVHYTFSLPYTARLQPGGLSYPVVFYRDGESRRVRMDTYDSATIMLAKKGKTYSVVPRIDRQICMAFKGEDSEAAQAMNALPDVSGWQYGGQQELNGEATHVWQYSARHAAKEVRYRLHVAPDGATPRRLYMHGNDMMSGAHFDEWVVDYTGYAPGPPDHSVFKTPDMCQDVEPGGGPSAQHKAAHLRMAALVPTVRYRGGDAEYDAFLATHGASRRHRSLADYQQRTQLFRANQAMIEAHNSDPSRTYAMAMNRFGDFTEEEFVALMLPKRARRQGRAAAATGGVDGQGGEASNAASSDAGSGAGSAGEAGGAVQRQKLGRHEQPYRPLVDPSLVPASLSWRGTGADGLGPMDQATCGSCWAFSAAGAMEGAWWRATGSRVSFSEQQIVDCSWGFVPDVPESNMACDGGEHWAGIGHIVDAGGIALTQDYPYKGQDGYCMAGATRRVGRFKGYARVPRYDDAALMEAVYSRGPVAISLDASQPSFRFYSSGVYREARCGYKPSELDHDLVLVGYGSSKEGDYWEVKNSWSDHWGDGGYFKIARDDRACGVTTDSVYAVVANDEL